MTTLIYIADPMCSWCYGFGPELTDLLQGLPEVPIEIVVGGLRAYQEKALDDEQRATLQSHWQQVNDATGLPFVADLLNREGFVYNTEPACRAIVTARTLAPQTALPVLQAIQQAFYAQGRDVTSKDVLADVAASAMTQAGFAIDAAAFAQSWASEASILATHGDFELAKKWGVYGFPTLVLERNGELDLVTSGFVPMPALVEKLQALVDGQAAA